MRSNRRFLRSRSLPPTIALVCLAAIAATALAADGDTERVSVAPGGADGDGEAGLSSTSADGRFVAFESRAANLVAADTNETQDVFVYDRLTRRTERVSVSSSGAQANSRCGSLSGKRRDELIA